MEPGAFNVPVSERQPFATRSSRDLSPDPANLPGPLQQQAPERSRRNRRADEPTGATT